MKVLKILFNPIFLLAAGLHAGLLMIPVAGGSSESIVPAPDPEGESITVTHIPLKKADKGGDQKSSGAQANKAAQQRKASSTDQANTSSGSAGGSSASTQRGSASTQQRRTTTSRNVSQELSNLPTPQTRPTPTPQPSRPASSRRSSTPAANNSSGSNSAASRRAATPPDLPQLLPPEKRQTLLASLLKEKDSLRDIPVDFLTWLTGVNKHYRYSEKGTTDDAVKLAKEGWLSTLGQDAGLVLLEAPDPLVKPLNISYPLQIETDNGPLMLRRCLTPEPEEGLIGVMVVEDGGVVQDSPTLLRSSGYPLLDDVALQTVQTYGDFPADESLQAYTVKVKVDYDEKSCVSLKKLGIEPLKSEESSDELPTPEPGGRNPLEEAEGEITPF